jgi:hypothetical protein
MQLINGYCLVEVIEPEKNKSGLILGSAEVRNEGYVRFIDPDYSDELPIGSKIRFTKGRGEVIQVDGVELLKLRAFDDGRNVSDILFVYE